MSPGEANNGMTVLCQDIRQALSVAREVDRIILITLVMILTQSVIVFSPV